VRGKREEGRAGSTEVGGQRAEIGGRRTEDGGRRSPRLNTIKGPQVKCALPLLNPLCCDWHQFNLASCYRGKFHGVKIAESKFEFRVARYGFRVTSLSAVFFIRRLCGGLADWRSGRPDRHRLVSYLFAEVPLFTFFC